MDAPSGTSEPGDGGVLILRKTNTSLPKLSVPLRTSAEATLKGLNVVSPGPMTFVSSLFAGDPYADQQSFANLFPSPDAKDGHSEGDSDGGESQPSTHSSRLKLLGPAKLPIRRSPCLTIPPGFSPTTLFDSPLLFPTAQVQPSPTTGTYQLLPPSKQNAESISDDNSKLDNDFVFKPHSQIHSSSGAIEMGAFGLSHQHFAMAQAIPQSVDSKSQSMPQASVAPLLDAKNEHQEKPSSTQAIVPAHLLPQLIEKPSEDGYKWRKYGQKQVKGSEYPRSYYKCTHPSCPVKKKVERSYDGQITEIVYKGEHNHTKPQASQKMALANTESFLMANERNGAYGNVADLSSALGYPNTVAGASELSQGSSSDDEGDDAEISRIDEHNEEDPELKRRKTDNSNEYANNMPLRTVHESRVVVQTTSDVDILDDGYRWRKYGQKVVKGNTHPRSYYKCTNGGCSVRKQVERSSKDPRSVITTYEGKHNHEVPTGKSGSHNDTSATSAPRMVVPANDGRSAVKSAVSLQEQILGQNRSIGAEAGCEIWMSDPSFSQKNAELFGDSLMGCGYGSLQGDHYYQQQEGLALVPKEEPGFVHSVEASLRPPNRNAHSSFYSSTYPP